MRGGEEDETPKEKGLDKRGWEFTRMTLYSVRVHKNDQLTNRTHPNPQF